MNRFTAISTLALGLLSGCGAEVISLTDDFADTPETERLRFFKEVQAEETLSAGRITGEGVTVTIMGEMVDPNHADLAENVHRQFNAFTRPLEVVVGDGNQAYRSNLLQEGDGHGTHIAGTIAAACDDIGIQGLACGASLDVYSLGAYDGSDRFVDNPQDRPETDEIFDFIAAFRTAITDVTRRGDSKITTGSFNIEAPAIVFNRQEPITRDSMAAMADDLDQTATAILGSPLFAGTSAADRAMLADYAAQYDDVFIPIMALTPALDEWALLARSIGDYQASGGVYIVTESNYQFGNLTSALNAMPSLAPEVDPALWLSVVMVEPTGIEAATSDAEVEAALEGPYGTPLNGCGEMAQSYCIVTPSYSVLSTMTERVAEPGDPIFELDGRMYQVYSGHSMGAPMVAATLALMQEVNKDRRLGLSMRTLVQILKDTASRDFEGYDPIMHGRGMLNVDAAIGAMN